MKDVDVKINTNNRSVLIRKKILDIIHNSNASHIGSSFSVVEILSSVYQSVDLNKIKNWDNDRDRIIVSKGHSAAALYATMNNFGLMDNQTLNTYYKNGSLLGGHVTHNVKYIEHSTGALGHGLSVALGMAIGAKAKQLKSHVFVVLGDAELHEGSNWEAFLLAGHLHIDNITILIDYNQLGGIGLLQSCCSLDNLKTKLDAYSLETYEVDGHNEEEIYNVIQKSKLSETPVAIICHTVKGKGVSFMENNNVWHYRPPNKDEYTRALNELLGGPNNAE